MPYQISPNGSASGRFTVYAAVGGINPLTRTIFDPSFFDGSQRNQGVHIAPINQAPEAIEHLAELGIDGNSAANGVFLPALEIIGNPQAVHSFQYSNMMRHGAQYIQEINTQILSTTTKEEALSVLDYFREGLLNGLIDYLYKD